MTYTNDLREVYSEAAEHLEMLPPHMHDGVALWITRGIEPGSFLHAVICNNLGDAVARADDINGKCLREWVMFFYNYAPSLCWGSPSLAREWCERGGLLGRVKPGDDVDDLPDDEPPTFDEALAAKCDADARYVRDMMDAGRGHLVRK